MEVVRLYEGSVNDDVVWDYFLNYVAPVLNPHLEDFVLPNSLLILDNVSAHSQPRLHCHCRRPRWAALFAPAGQLPPPAPNRVPAPRHRCALHLPGGVRPAAPSNRALVQPGSRRPAEPHAHRACSYPGPAHSLTGQEEPEAHLGRARPGHGPGVRHHAGDDERLPCRRPWVLQVRGQCVPLSLSPSLSLSLSLSLYIELELELQLQLQLQRA